MKKTVIWVILFVLLIGLIIGTYFLYDHLKSGYAPGLVPVIPTQPSSSPETEPPQPSLPAETQPQGTEPPATEPSATEPSATEPDYTAPDFTVYDAQGNPVKLSDLKGTPVVLNLWASWCPPCREELPDFQRMYEKYGDRVAFMMVNMTDGVQETQAKAQKHIDDNGFTFPLYFDHNGEAAYAYYATSLPQTFFINDKGELYTYYPGMISAELLEMGIGYILPS